MTAVPAVAKKFLFNPEEARLLSSATALLRKAAIDLLSSRPTFLQRPRIAKAKQEITRGNCAQARKKGTFTRAFLRLRFRTQHTFAPENARKCKLVVLHALDDKKRSVKSRYNIERVNAA
jgi:hypothetical protein